MVPLLADCLKRWDPGHDPFFAHAEARHFVAVRNGRDVGRIAAAVDREHDRIHGGRTGFFGWFECEDSRETSVALLDAAARWLRDHGRDRVRGPLSYTMNGISGLLVEDRRPGPPVIDMAYNPPWYAGHLEAWGLAKAKDLLALWIDSPEAPDPRIARIAARVIERGRFRLRSIRTDRAGFAQDVEHVLRIYNGAWESNWGFVPLTPDELRHQARQFRPILVPELLLLAERDGLPVAFSLALPDVNWALARIQGRLWPWALLRLARELRRVRTARIITLGILPEWRRSGLDAALIHETVVRGTSLGMTGGECSWILEDNTLMIAAARQAGASEYRRYRVYEKALGARLPD